MDEHIRRVVTANDEKGKAVVLFDGPAPNRNVRPDTGTAATLIWVTDQAPARFSGRRDTAAVKIGVASAARGSILRVVDFPPVTGDVAHIDHAQMLRAMGLPEPPPGPRPGFQAILPVLSSMQMGKPSFWP